MQHGASSTPLPHPPMRTRPHTASRWHSGQVRAYAGWSGSCRSGSPVCARSHRRFTDVFHRVALTLDRVPSVGWCNRFEYGLLLLLLHCSTTA